MKRSHGIALLGEDITVPNKEIQSNTGAGIEMPDRGDLIIGDFEISQNPLYISNNFRTFIFRGVFNNENEKQPIIIKTLSPRFLSGQEEKEAELFRTWFLRENLLVSSIQQNYPDLHIARLIGFDWFEGEDSMPIYIAVLEQLKGRGLGKIEYTSLDKTFNIFDPIAEALDVLNKEGVVHGDIKPDSIMVNESEDKANVLDSNLFDFGISNRVIHSDESLPWSTPGWYHHNRRKRKELVKQDDIYGFISCIYSHITRNGTPPFGGDDAKLINYISLTHVGSQNFIKEFSNNKISNLDKYISELLIDEKKQGNTNCKEILRTIKNILTEEVTS